MRHPIVSLVSLLALASGCDAGAARLPIGAACLANGQCEAGVCGGGLCLTPEIDSDSDGLVNGVEAGLGTDPIRPDTDGDGVLDFVEVVDVAAPADRDGDGAIDAVESRLEDSDADCVPDEEDPDEGAAGVATLTDRCCCEGACSEIAPDVTVLAECVPGQPELLGCARSADCPLGLTCQAQPGRGQCTPVDPLEPAPAVVVPCATDAECAAGRVCTAAAASGTCVDDAGQVPKRRPSLVCTLDPADSSDVAPPLQPACAPPG